MLTGFSFSFEKRCFIISYGFENEFIFHLGNKIINGKTFSRLITAKSENEN